MVNLLQMLDAWAGKKPTCLLMYILIGITLNGSNLLAIGDSSNLPPKAGWLQERVAQLEEAERNFNEGVILYRNGEYEQARLKFSVLLGALPPHQRITAAYLMYAKVLQRLGQYSESINYARDLIGKFPVSKYVDDAHFCNAANYYLLDDFYESARDFMWVIDYSDSDDLRKKSARLLEALAASYLSLDELNELSSRYAKEGSNIVLTVKIAERELQEGRKADALDRLEEFVKKYPRSQRSSRIRSLMEWARSERPGRIRAGVILPLTGYYAEEGRAVLRGIQYGLRKSKSRVAATVELIVRDSESNIVKAVQQAQALARDHSVLFVIGELEGTNSVAVGVALSQVGVPLLVPVSSENGLTTVGDRIFQMSADFDRQGRQLARFAVEDLGLKSFATLAPRDWYGQMMTDSFVETVDALGGVIVAQKWYYQGTTDVGRQMISMREIGLKRAIRDTLLMEMEHVTLAQLDAAWRARNEAFKKKSEDHKTLLQANEIPVNSIDAVFFPIYNDEISMIVPQFVLQNMKAQILGGSYWNDAEQLRLNKENVNGAIFVTDHYVDTYSKEYIRFRDEFRVQMGTTPGEMEIYGYDAISIALDAIDKDGTSYESFAQTLRSISDFQGMNGPISFDGGTRVSNDTPILQYEDGTIKKLR